jgi:hypothetical protein
VKHASAVALAAIAICAPAEPGDRTAQLNEAVSSLTGAIVSNDATGIETWLAQDWAIIDADGHKIDRDRFLGVVRSGNLVHHSMALDEVELRRVGNAMLWVGHAHGSGTYRGDPFTFDERSASIWEWRKGRWTCLFTQLTAIKPPPAGGGSGRSR